MNINKFCSCPICRKLLLPNNIYKISNKNNFLKFENYNNNYLISKVGTKITFILKFCFQNKDKKLLIISEYYSFLNKINKYLKLFNFNSLLINNNDHFEYQNYLINKFNKSNNDNILLIQSNNLFIKNMTINKLDYLLFSNIFRNKCNKYLFLKKLRLRKNFNLVKIIQIKINNSIECF